ncbi:MAG: DUF2961 domain-containing protein [Fimbriimonadaceae bacterium]|nr:DUF2961 domain-containing protein [Fimbriimonadaceae bacterium]
MKPFRLFVPLLIVFLATVAPAQRVTTASLLREMSDLSRLSTTPNPAYTCAQASSYDRASVREGTPEWFANADYGQYIRKETNAGRTEWVMADLQGPGAVVRIWSANPNGVVRFYYDGEAEPRLTAKLDGLLTGNVPPWGEPFAYTAARGCNLYFPFPYSKSLKITIDETGRNTKGLYYHVNFRTYAKGTVVETFDPKQLASLNLPKSLTAPPDQPGKSNPFSIAPSQAMGWSQGNGPAAIRLLQLKIDFPQVPAETAWTDPRHKHNILRSLELQIDFDDETCVRIPIADFFQTGTKANAFDTLPVSVSGSEFTARWPMPYARQANIRLVNHGKVAVTGSLSLRTEPLRSFAGQMHFHAQWGYDYKGSRPMADMDFVRTRGEGRFVGAVLTVANPVRAWWGEGDEKVFVDGEEFPSTFGTGTEDYFGYAWCCNLPFVKPYHAQPQCDGPDNFGYAVNSRWHIFDDIPFTKSLRFAIEKWHWANTSSEFSFAAFWYAKPGGKPTAELDPDMLRFPEVSLKHAPKDAIEAESLRFSANGGKTEVQQIGGPSDEKQIWWMDAAVGNRLTVAIPSPGAGKYRVRMNACMATDYGAHRLYINGVEAGIIDFYSPDLMWKEFDLGVFDLKAGENTLTVDFIGSNPASKPKRSMFGLDWVHLKPVIEG